MFENENDGMHDDELLGFLKVWGISILIGLGLGALLTFVFMLTEDDKSFETIRRVGTPIFGVLLILGFMIFPFIVGFTVYNPIVSKFAEVIGVDLSCGGVEFHGDEVWIIKGPLDIIRLPLALISLVFFAATSYLLFPYMLLNMILKAIADFRGKNYHNGITFLICMIVDVVAAPAYIVLIYYFIHGRLPVEEIHTIMNFLGWKS